MRIAAVLTAVAVLMATAWLAATYVFTGAEADAQQSRNCAMDAVEQSICIYEAILADVNENYRQRGGGGISSIVQESTTTFIVTIAQEGRKDLLTYTVKIGRDGKVEIVDKTESTQSY
jgi:hypothetical protein